MKKAVALLVVCLGLGFSITSTGREIVVISTADSGQGSLRWALVTASSGDVVTFDPRVFPPENPAAIYPRSELPAISSGKVTVDASNAGVVIDGSGVSGYCTTGLQVYSDHNTVMGLSIMGFSCSGIAVCGGSHNVIGGDRTQGLGPNGQGNCVGENGVGIDICDYGTEDNHVLGNLVGLTSDGRVWGNRHQGIWIENGAANNVIGPDNVIAYNHEVGIDVYGEDAYENRISRNNIFRNERQAIRLWSGGNKGLPAPWVSDSDQADGLAIGSACPGCVVELFSDLGDEGLVYEGQATADAAGAFRFSKRGPLEGSTIVATATGAAGNTSELSRPAGSFASMQAENGSPRWQLVSKRSAELADNRIGGLWARLWGRPLYSLPLLEQRDIFPLGFKRATLAINSSDWDTVAWDKPELEIHPAHDALFTDVAANQIKITYRLNFWNKAENATWQDVPVPRFKSEHEILAYLDFVRFIARSLGDRVYCFELWGEPSLLDCPNMIEVQDYINLAKRAIPVIRAECPQAKIMVGSVDYLMLSHPQEYLFAVLESEIMPLVDVIAWHPMYWTSPEHDAPYYYEYPDIVRRIKEAASSHGFQGEYEADELSWTSPDWEWGDDVAPLEMMFPYTEEVCAKYHARGVVMHLGMDVTAGLGFVCGDRPYVSDVIKNLCTVMAGHEAIDMPVEIEIPYKPTDYCGFRYPDGDRILAVWTDGVAQDDDPGVLATITFPGLVTEAVTGIDVLHGFEQELTFEIDGANTIVRDLLVKDYPTLIHLGNVTTGPDYEETVGDGFHRLSAPGAGSSSGGSSDRDGDGVPDDKDYCPDRPGKPETNGC